MGNKDIREYYERLSQERFKLIQERTAQNKHYWSAWHRYRFKEKLIDLISVKIKEESSKTILNLGCGNGSDFLPLFKKNNFIGYGVDFSFSQLQQACLNRELNACRLIQADVEAIPFKNSSFDVVIFSEVIEHLKDSRKSLLEIHRILKDDGYLFLSTPNRYEYFHLLGQLFPLRIRKLIRNSIQPNWDIDPTEYDSNIEEHVHLFSLGELVTTLKNQGFSIEEIHAGRLSVPFPRIFDKLHFLQAVWTAFDNFISKLSFTIFIKANFIVVLKKKSEIPMDQMQALKDIFLLPKHAVVNDISPRFYNAFEGFFQDSFKFEKYIQAIKSVFNLIQGKNKIILDAGCGFGLISVLFSYLGAKEVYAIDFSGKELEGFKNILSRIPPLKNLQVQKMDCQRIEYPDNFFDVVFASDSISHIHNLDDFFKEVKRVLKRNGIFYIYESNSSLSIMHNLKQRKYWRMVEYGPVDQRIDMDKPFSLIRQEIILECFPQIEAKKLEYLVKLTQGMVKDEIKIAIERYLKTAKLEPKKGFKYIDPRSGMLAEKSINPFVLKKILHRFNFRARIIPPYFYYTFPFLVNPIKNNRLRDIVKAFVKKLIRYTYPLSLLTTPRFELLAENEKI